MFTEEDIVKIKELYLQGISREKIARYYYHCRVEKISEIIASDPAIERMPIKARKLSKVEQLEICELYKTGHYNQKIIAEKFHCCTSLIHDVLVEYNIPIGERKVRHNASINLNEHYFQVIDSETKAYFLGFLFADGCVHGGQLSFEIHFKDKEILDIFKEELGLGTKISYRKRGNTEMVCIRCSNKYIIEDLAKYGIIQNKTKNTKHLPDIPNEFIAPFIRGLIDGDGWYTMDKSGYLHVGFVTNYKSTCEDFIKYCDFLTGIKSSIHPTRKNKDGDCVGINFVAKEYVKQLVTALYTNCNICLTRKYKKVEFILESKNDEDIV